MSAFQEFLTETTPQQVISDALDEYVSYLEENKITTLKQCWDLLSAVQSFAFDSKVEDGREAIEFDIDATVMGDLAKRNPQIHQPDDNAFCVKFKGTDRILTLPTLNLNYIHAGVYPQGICYRLNQVENPEQSISKDDVIAEMEDIAELNSHFDSFSMQIKILSIHSMVLPCIVISAEKYRMVLPLELNIMVGEMSGGARYIAGSEENAQ